MSTCGELVPCQLCSRYGECSLDSGEHGRWLVSRRLATVRHRVLVLSNKGGVGKSTLAANLAVTLAARGHRVGLLDADLTGPNVPYLLGVAGARLAAGAKGLEPVSGPEGVRVASVGFMLQGADDAVMWRDSFKFEVLVGLVGGVHWGDLDWLVVDMPPGTGGEFLALADLLSPIDGAIAVSTPHSLARLDVRKAVSACAEAGVPVLGLVENMAAIVCPRCGGTVEWAPARAGGPDLPDVPLLARIPLDPQVQAHTDAGRPFVLAAPGSAPARAVAALAGALTDRVAAPAGPRGGESAAFSTRIELRDGTNRPLPRHTR